MNLHEALDVFFRRHPRLFVVAVLLLAAAAAIALHLYGQEGPPLVYKTF